MILRARFSLLIFFLIIASLACFGDNNKSESLTKVDNKTYSSTCGACHFAYQPGLLPLKMWIKILDSPEGHAGGSVDADSKTKAEIKKYLTQNCAEKSTWEKSGKILNSTISDTPVRISEVSYIKGKHREINEKIFARETIGTRGNCLACHRSANNGIYDDDDVIIPD